MDAGFEGVTAFVPLFSRILLKKFGACSTCGLGRSSQIK